MCKLYQILKIYLVKHPINDKIINAIKKLKLRKISINLKN